MIFWAITAITLASLIWWMWISWDFFETIPGMLLGLLGEVVMVAFIWALVAGAGVQGLAHLFTPDYEPGETTEVPLIALATRDTVEGQFRGGIFASYGYIDGKRVLSYVTRDSEGGIRLGYVNARDSVVFEGVGDPRIETHHWFKENGWVWPFGVFATAETYSVHVPEGSIVQGYEVAP